jgi:glycine/D-amino acid oxidase-like deaminating enzyme
MSKGEMASGGFEYESMQLLQKRGHEFQRLGGAKLKARFPAWHAAHYPDGYYNPQAGWAESGAVVAQLIQEAKKAGVALFEGRAFERLLENGSRAAGIHTTDGADHPADYVVMAAGPWTPVLLPHLESVILPVGQPVLHFRPENYRDYQPPKFVVWAADIANTGWYGFPAQDDGTLKVANHGPGWQRDPRGDRTIPKGEEDRFRAFFADTFPDLVNAPKIAERMCFYCDAWDGNFYITPDPEREGLILSTGGSGHGFKFAPILGQITADVLEDRKNKYASRFAWRTPGKDYLKEHSRYRQPA